MPQSLNQMLHPQTAAAARHFPQTESPACHFLCSPGTLLLVLEPASCAQSPRPTPVPSLAGTTRMPDPRCHNTNPESSRRDDSESAAESLPYALATCGPSATTKCDSAG